MGVMMLAASKGTVLQIQTEGEGEEEAMQALVALIDDKFGEGE
jgi:phosphocarrier protein